MSESEICVTWEWQTTSALHVGSGLSRLGVADSLVQRDPAGNAVIYGEAVRGAIRMGAEQVAAWLDAPQHCHYASQGTAEPGSWPLARLFGGDATARCTPATLVGGQRTRSQVFAATAIDRATGTADERTLRKTEIVPSGVRFRACYTATVADHEVSVVETLLLAALASVDSVGGKAGIGWGRVTLASVCVNVGGKERARINDAISAERISQLKCELHRQQPGSDAGASGGQQPSVSTGPASAPVTPSSSVQSSLNAQQWFKIEITLVEPTCLPDSPEISNKVTTKDWIAATTVRGALAAYWRRSGCKQAEIMSWLSDTTAWTPAFRIVDGALAVPAPRSFVTTKRALGDVRPVHDTFAGRFPTANDGSLVQWRSIAGDSIVGGSKPTLAEDKGLRETRMHVARDYRTRGKRSGALYAKENLTAGTKFVCWARVPKDAFDGQRPSKFTVLIGRRVSAGNGRATVEVTEVRGPQFYTPEETPDDHTGAPSTTSEPTAEHHHEDCVVVVQLVSPAIVRDADGYPVRTLSLDWWEKTFAVPVCARSDDKGTPEVRTAPGRRGGWMTTWGHARAAVTTIDAGSVWRLRCGSLSEAQCLRDKLRKRAYVGERSHEGFGWIAVDPPWLVSAASESSLPAESPAVPKALGESAPWPGATQDAGKLAPIACRMMKTKLPAACGPALQELAARVRAAPSSDRVARLKKLKAFYVARAKRDRERHITSKATTSKATRVMDVLPKSDEVWRDPETLLFALGILITRAPGGSE